MCNFHDFTSKIDITNTSVLDEIVELSSKKLSCAKLRKRLLLADQKLIPRFHINI